MFVFFIEFSKELHSHNGKDEDDNGKDEGKISQVSNRFSHNGN